jgi:ferrous iron transport protein A
MPVTMKLSQLMPGDRAVIRAVHAEQGLHLRLAALGFRVGKALQLVRRGIMNGPLHVRIGATEVAIRVIDAGQIDVYIDE